MTTLAAGRAAHGDSDSGGVGRKPVLLREGSRPERLGLPLLNVASAMKSSGQTIDGIRVVVNAAAARPLRLHAVEAAVIGKPRNRADG